MQRNKNTETKRLANECDAAKPGQGGKR